MNLCMRKLGMDQIKIQNSRVIGVTFMWCEMLKVLAHKTVERDGYSAMVVGSFGKKASLNKAQEYLYKDYDKAPEKIYEYRSDDVKEVGADLIPSEFFGVDEYVDIAGTTKGRGFAGCMKRWNFHGLRASHGVSRAHRKPGSTGQRNRPGKVFKGKKMPGHYGAERVTVQSMKVVHLEKMELQGKMGWVLGVHGAVPGPKDAFCFVSPAIKKKGKVKQ